MKSKLKIIFTLFSGLLALNLYGQSFSVGELKYTILEDNTVEVTGLVDGVEATSLTIPENVTYMDQSYTVTRIGGFLGNKKLEDVLLPSSIIKIQGNAFRSCSALTSINLPSSLTTIGNSAFSDCTSLKGEIVIPSSVDSIGSLAFSGCESISSVNFMANVKSFPQMPFSGCTSLERVEVHAPVDTIVFYAFSSCSSLKSITLPATLKYLDGNSFSRCYSLSEIIIDEDNPCYFSENGIIYTKDKTSLVCWPAAKGKIEIKDGVKVIEYGAFEENIMITSVTLPASIEFIALAAFFDCNELESMYIYAETPPLVGTWWLSRYEISTSNGFDIIRAKIYVPYEAYDSYKNSDDYAWKEHRDYIYPMPRNGVEALPTDENSQPTSYEVFSLDGRQVLKAASRDELRGLERGIYIVNGKKMAL